MPFVDDYTKTVYVDENVQPTGTPDISAANLNNAENAIKEVHTGLATWSSRVETAEADIDTLSSTSVFQDVTFRTGLVLEWVSATQVRVISGAAYVLGASNVGQNTASTTITPSGLVANTWYYVYAIYVAGALSFEVSTTAPTIYRGVARQKSGDASRRFVGEFHTRQATTDIMKFRKVGNHVVWLENVYAQPLVFGGGSVSPFNATTPTSLSLSNCMPPHSTLADLHMVINEGDLDLALFNNEAPFTTGLSSAYWINSPLGSTPREEGVFDITAFPTNSTQAIQYQWSAAPDEGRSIHCTGYWVDE